MDGINVSDNRHIMVPISEMLRPTISSGQKLALPVANFSPWANFEYVQGVPAGADGGYSITKLQILDAIIGSLVGLRDKHALQTVPHDTQALNDNQVDSLISDLGQRLQSVATSAPKVGLADSLGNSFGLAISQTGAAVNILV